MNIYQNYRFVSFYLFAIVFSNVAFSYFPLLQTPLGPIPSMALFVGFVFVLRDYAQREHGNKVLLAMLAGCVISAFFADGTVVVASVAAFAVSEIADYLVYTWTKRPFHERVLLSSLISVPVDTVIFLTLIGVYNPASMVAMSISKIAAAIVIYMFYLSRGKK